jgi:PAS domain S-box-containing protein
MTKTSLELEIIEKLPVVVFEYIIRKDGVMNFTYISPVCERILGLSQKELLSGEKSMREFIHPEDWPSFVENRESVRLNLTDFNWEGRVRLLKKDLWISATGKPNRTAEDNILVHGVIQDISTKKLLEAERYELERHLKSAMTKLNLSKHAQLNQSEKKYRSLMEHLSVAVIVHTDGRLQFANDYAVKMIGAKSAEELTGRDIMDFVHPSFKASIAERVVKLSAGENVPAMEEKIIRLDGSEVDVEVIAYPFEFDDKPAVQVILTDITEKKKKEQEARKTETLFTQLFENSPFAIVMLSEDGMVRKVNKGFESLFGFNSTELYGHSLNKFIISDEFQSEGDSINKNIAESKIVRLETVRFNREKQRLNVIVYGVPVSLDEKTISIFGVYVDITERKKVEEELKIRNSELDNFVYKVSHDLRAPLTSILGLVNLATVPGNTDNPLEYLKMVGTKIGHLDNFITEVLSHSKNLKLDLQVSKINLRELIEETFSSVNYLTGMDDMKLNVSVEGNNFHSDPWRLSEILRNLMSNSVKYRNASLTNPEISIQASVHEDKCHLKFADNGIGIPAQHLPKVFDMFYRAHEKSDGSGLGLYIVNKAVEKLGGQIKIESEHGKGTQFDIVLPNRVNKESNTNNQIH